MTRTARQLAHLVPSVLCLVLLAQGCGRSRMEGTTAGPLAFSSDRYPVAGETPGDPGRDGPIYRTVLRFYRPAGRNIRLLDRRLLPTDSSHDASGILKLEVATAMISGLRSFCLMDERQECDGRTEGGVIRLSPVFWINPDRARVVVRYTSVGRYAPGVESSQVFLLEREHDGWRIRARGPVKQADH